jgi:threonyl-tRNA synthetase
VADYATETAAALKRHGFRCFVDERNEKIGRKIRDNEVRKVPYMLIVGEQEAASGEVSVRRHGKGDQGSMTRDAFIHHLQEALDQDA